MGLFKDLGLDTTVAQPKISHSDAMNILYAATVALEKQKDNEEFVSKVLEFAKLIAAFV